MIYLKINNDECEASDLQDYFCDLIDITPVYADGYCSWHKIHSTTLVFQLIDIMNNLDIDNFEPEIVTTCGEE